MMGRAAPPHPGIYRVPPPPPRGPGGILKVKKRRKMSDHRQFSSTSTRPCMHIFEETKGGHFVYIIRYYPSMFFCLKIWANLSNFKVFLLAL